MKVISIFSGAGGMDLGFKRAGFDVIWANDNYIYACETYKKNFGISPVHGDIRKIKHFPSADILIACNPCQGFSIIGARKESDKRNRLYQEIFRCLRQVKPKYFVVENVKGLKSLYEGKFLKLMLNGFQRIGYKVKWEILDAKNFGVPQHRERIIIVGVNKKLEKEYHFPSKTHGPALKPYVTLKESIGNLPAPNKRDYYHADIWPFFYMSRNRVADWNKVSYTIQTTTLNIPLHPSSPRMQKISQNKYVFTADSSKYRRLSVNECARIQTFPDDFEFLGYLQSKYRLIGNAVPPLLAERIAESIVNIENKTK